MKRRKDGRMEEQWKDDKMNDEWWNERKKGG